jgi:hypothetical protein
LKDSPLVDIIGKLSLQKRKVLHLKMIEEATSAADSSPNSTEQAYSASIPIAVSSIKFPYFSRDRR